MRQILKVEEVFVNLLTSAGSLTPGLMAYFMFKQNQLLIAQKDKHQEELMIIVKEIINKTPKSQN